MFYYIVYRIGDGTKENPYRPDCDGAFVWGADNVCTHCNTYVLASPVQILETDNIKEVTDLNTACSVRSLAIYDVDKWFIGG